MKLILTKSDWLNINFGNFIIPNIKESASYNSAIRDLRLFLLDLIHITCMEDELFLFDNILINDQIIDIIFLSKNNDMVLSNLYKNNKIPFFYNLLMKLDIMLFKDEEEDFLNMFKHLVCLAGPKLFQNQIEFISNEYKSGKGRYEIEYDFQKFLRNGSNINNTHIEMLLWHMLQVTDVPSKAIKYIIVEGNLKI